MRKSTILIMFVLMAAMKAIAQNPVVQTWYTSDPAPMVFGDRIYMYTGHDEDKADFFWMNEWRIYSSSDMVNWTDHGSPLNLESFSWADDRAWAAQTIERNGKFYWYICAHSKISGGMAIGVAVADSPTGPFRDAIGKPLYEDGKWDHIDPTVFIDDDDQAWLFWGNPVVYYAKLNPDMISFASEVKTVKQTIEGFGSPDMKERKKDVKYKDCYTEGPWIMKAPKPAKGYYLLYAAGGVPEHIAYSSAPSPEGPWTYRGEIMPLEDTKSFTNHCGVADFKGHSYFFYHTGKLPGGGGFGRSAAIEEFKYNADGTFPIIHHTDAGVAPIGTLNPYKRTEAETMAWSSGLKSEQNDETGVYISDINNGDYIKVREADFGNMSPKKFTASVASALLGGSIEVRVDSLGGKVIASLKVSRTGGWEKWQTVTVPVIETITGCHDIYFVFKGMKGGKLFTFDWWRFDMLDAPFIQTRIVEDGGTGPYKAIMTETEGLGEHTLLFPQDLSAFGADRQLPVLVWGNGACNNSPFEHIKFLSEIASYGYLVVATGYIPMTDEWYRGPMSKSAQQIESIDWVYAQNADPKSPFYQKIDVKNLCVAGM